MEFLSDDNFDTQDTGKLNDGEYSPYEEYSNEPQSDHTGNHHSENTSGRPFPNVFALFAKSLGIFSIFCAVFSIFFGTFTCGGLAIVLAILSKGYNTKMEKNAVVGLAAGVIGIVLQISVLTVSVYNVIHVPEFREQFHSLYEQMYGEPIDDSINDILDEMGLPNEEGGLL